MIPEHPIGPASTPDPRADDGPDVADPTSTVRDAADPTSGPEDAGRTGTGPEAADPTSGPDDAGRPGAGPTAAEVAALDAVRSADPAAGTEADLTTLRAVLARAGAPLAADELAARRPARRPARWIQVAAVAAGLVLLGAGGGYAAGSRGDGTAHAGGLGGGGSTTAEGTTSSVPYGPPRSGDAASGSGRSSVGLWYGGGQRTVYTADGLSGSTGTATAWGFDAAATFSSETAARVAHLLDVPGKPQLAGGSTAWTVGDGNGPGRTLTLDGDGTTSFTFDDTTKQPWDCAGGGGANGSTGGGATGAAGSTGSGAATSGALVAPAGPATAEPAPQTTTAPPDQGPIFACTPHEPEAPTGQRAIDQARVLMDKLGATSSSYRFTELQPKLRSVTTVQAELLAGGVPSGVQWTFTEVSDGFASVSGQLAPLVELGSYPVVSPRDAVARLTDPRFGPSYGGIVPAYDGQGDVAVGAPAQTSPSAPDAAAKPGAPTPTNPGTATPGAALPWPVRTVAVDSATLGLLLDTDGRTARLLPAYHLTSDGGGAWDVMAVAVDRLDTAATH